MLPSLVGCFTLGEVSWHPAVVGCCGLPQSPDRENCARPRAGTCLSHVLRLPTTSPEPTLTALFSRQRPAAPCRVAWPAGPARGPAEGRGWGGAGGRRVAEECAAVAPRRRRTIPNWNCFPFCRCSSLGRLFCRAALPALPDAVEQGPHQLAPRQSTGREGGCAKTDLASLHGPAGSAASPNEFAGWAGGRTC